MTAPKLSLGQQIEAVAFAHRRQQSLCNGARAIRELRPESTARYDEQRLAAAVRTLSWLQEHEDETRKLFALSPERRLLLWQHIGRVVDLLDEIEAQRVADIRAELTVAEPTGGA